jgi:hypothetical protein
MFCTQMVSWNYSWTAVSAGNTFQDLPQLQKTADNTERFIYRHIT